MLSDWDVVRDCFMAIVADQLIRTSGVWIGRRWAMARLRKQDELLGDDSVRGTGGGA